MAHQRTKPAKPSIPFTLEKYDELVKTCGYANVVVTGRWIQVSEEEVKREIVIVGLRNHFSSVTPGCSYWSTTDEEFLYLAKCEHSFAVFIEWWPC